MCLCKTNNVSGKFKKPFIRVILKNKKKNNKNINVVKNGQTN